MTTPTLFVAFSHTLTNSQIAGFKSQYGTFVPQQLGMGDNGGIDVGHGMEILCQAYYDAKIVTLKDVNPELQQQMSNISANAILVEIQELAKKIVAEAVKAGATHFFCTGEPTLTMWANLYASKEAHFFNIWRSDIDNSIIFDREVSVYASHPDIVEGDATIVPAMVCIQSTTERKSVKTTQPDGTVVKTAVFSHVQWREMF